jgi:DNA-binding CsgD family transcriptional regulator
MDISEFTPRQREVIVEMCKGKANKEIARELGMAEATVKLHLTEIFRTMGVSSRARAIILASDLPVTNREFVELTDLDILKEFTEATFNTMNSNTWHEKVIQFSRAIENKTKG